MATLGVMTQTQMKKIRNCRKGELTLTSKKERLKQRSMASAECFEQSKKFKMATKKLMATSTTQMSRATPLPPPPPVLPLDPSVNLLELNWWTMSPEEEIEHLLDAKEYMRTGDSSGYVARFVDKQPEVEKKLVKKRRGSQYTVLSEQKLPECANKCALDMMIEDVREGCVVCTQCGLIQSLVILEDARTGATFHDGVSRIVVHHYSRIAHWVANIASLQGETKITLTENEENSLRQFCQKEGDRLGKGVFAVREAIRRGIIPYRFLRHANAIAFRLWPEDVKLPSLSDSDIRAILLQLRRYEDAWQEEILAKSTVKRKNFPAFRFMLPIIAEDLSLPHLADLVAPLSVLNCIRKLNSIVALLRANIDLKKSKQSK